VVLVIYLITWVISIGANNYLLEIPISKINLHVLNGTFNHTEFRSQFNVHASFQLMISILKRVSSADSRVFEEYRSPTGCCIISIVSTFCCNEICY